MSGAKVPAHSMEPGYLCGKSDTKPAHRMVPGSCFEKTDGPVADRKMVWRHRYATLWDCYLDVARS